VGGYGGPGRPIPAYSRLFPHKYARFSAPRIAKRSSFVGHLTCGGPGRPIAAYLPKMGWGVWRAWEVPSRQIAPPRIAKRSSFVGPLTSGGLGFAYRVSDRPLSGNLLTSVGNTTPIQPLKWFEAEPDHRVSENQARQLGRVAHPASLIECSFPCLFPVFAPVSTRYCAKRKPQVADFQLVTKPFPIISNRFQTKSKSFPASRQSPDNTGNGGRPPRPVGKCWITTVSELRGYHGPGSNSSPHPPHPPRLHSQSASACESRMTAP
jgi:hypothetical protein